MLRRGIARYIYFIECICIIDVHSICPNKGLKKGLRLETLASFLPLLGSSVCPFQSCSSPPPVWAEAAGIRGDTQDSAVNEKRKALRRPRSQCSKERAVNSQEAEWGVSGGEGE